MAKHLKQSILWILLLLLTGGAFAQSRTVTGKVQDEKGAPLEGITVNLKGTTSSVRSNDDGTFSIPVTGKNPVIILTSVGYARKEVPVGSDNSLDITLNTSASQLNEVVITGFGTRKDTRKLTYAVQEVQAAQLQTAPAPNIINSLQGKLAGVRIDQGSGGAGSSSRIRIRGNTSLQGNQQPLFVIDGVLIKPGVTGPETWSDNNNVDFGNILKNLNDEDIETISVLKGSAASALYGSGAQNGVILITTKKGRQTKGLGVTFNMTQMWDKAYKLPDLQTEYGGGTSPVFQKDAQNVDMIDPANGQYYDYGPKLDGHMVKDIDGHMRPWKRYDILDFFETGRQEDYNVAIQGATEKNSIRASYTKNLTKGIIPNGAKLDRNTFMIRGTQKLGNIFNIDAVITYANSDNSNPVRQVSNYNPLFRMTYYRANTIDWDYWVNNFNDRANGGRISGAADPNGVGMFLWSTFNYNQYSHDDNLRANIDITTNIRPWLTLLTRGNFNNYDTKIEKKFLGADAKFSNGSYYVEANATRSYRLQGLLTATKDLTKDLNGSLTIGAEENKDKIGDILIQETTNGLNPSNPTFFSINNSVDKASSKQKYNPSKLTDAIYTYGDITWKSMLTASFSVRKDYNSTLTYSNGNGTYSFVYPSVGMSFIFSELLKNKSTFDFLNYGQLRASYGITGKDYNPYDLNKIGNYNIDGTTEIVTSTGGISTLPNGGFIDQRLPNRNFKNEQTKEFEVGTAMRFLQNRLGIDVSYYVKNTYDQVLDLTIPAETGGNTAVFNVGQIRNKGVEILLNAEPLKSRNFSWNFSANFSSNKNTVVELAPGVTSYDLMLAFGNDVRAIAKPGQQYGAVYSKYSFAEYQAVDAEGKPINSPSNGKRVLGSAPNGSNGYTFLRSGDYAPGLVQDKYLGTIMEKFIAGTYQTFKYKDFQLNVQVDAKIGGLMASGTHQYGGSNGSFAYSLPGRDAEHGGLKWTDKAGNERNDGIIPDGVFEDGITATVDGQTIDLGGMSWQEAYDKGYVTPKGALEYYEDLTQWSSGIREYSVFENSWVALREVSVGYNLPASIASKFKVNNLRLNLIGRNLTYLWKNAKGGINPEGLSSNNAAAFAEYGGLPYVRNLGFSLNVNF